MPAGLSAPPPRSRKPLYFGLTALAILAVVAIVVAVLLPKPVPASGAQSANEAVRAYLNALAHGDADAVLSLSKNPPTDRTLLTDDILRRQLEHMPISDIRILTSDGEGPAVHVSAKFGDQVSDTTLLVMPPQPGRPWQVDHAAIELTTADDALAPALANSITLFGAPAPKSGTAYMFPGWLGLGTTNPYVDIKRTLAQPTLLNGLTGIAQMNLMPHFTINDDGKAAATAAVTAALDRCAQSKQLAPPGCPQRLPAGDFVDGTVSWAKVQPNGIDVGRFFNDQQGTITFLGMATFLDLTVEQTAGGTFSMPELVVAVNGTADMTQEPPTITLAAPQ